MFIFSIFWCFVCEAGFADASAEMSLEVSSRYHIISAIPSHCHHLIIISSFIMSSYHRSSCHHRTLISHCRLSQCVVSFSHLQRALIQSPGKTRWCQVEHGSSFYIPWRLDKLESSPLRAMLHRRVYELPVISLTSSQNVVLASHLISPNCFNNSSVSTSSTTHIITLSLLRY